MGRKAVNVISGIIQQEQEHKTTYKSEQEHELIHEFEHEHGHIPLKRDRELKTKRVNLLLPPSLAAWFKETAYSEGLSLNDAAILAFQMWGQSVGKAYEAQMKKN